MENIILYYLKDCIIIIFIITSFLCLFFNIVKKKILFSLIKYVNSFYYYLF